MWGCVKKDHGGDVISCTMAHETHCTLSLLQIKNSIFLHSSFEATHREVKEAGHAQIMKLLDRSIDHLVRVSTEPQVT